MNENAFELLSDAVKSSPVNLRISRLQGNLKNFRAIKQENSTSETIREIFKICTQHRHQGNFRISGQFHQNLVNMAIRAISGFQGTFRDFRAISGHFQVFQGQFRDFKAISVVGISGQF